MDRSHRHFKYPFSFDVTEMMLALLSTQQAIPRKVLLERVCSPGPMFMPDQASQIRMPERNQTEHVANLTLVPLGGMNMRRDGGEYPIMPSEFGRQHHPMMRGLQGEQVVQAIGVTKRSEIHRPQK